MSTIFLMLTVYCRLQNLRCEILMRSNATVEVHNRVELPARIPVTRHISAYLASPTVPVVPEGGPTSICMQQQRLQATATCF